MTDTEPLREHHHLVGSSIHPGGVMKGCAHSDAEYRAYIAFGTLPNPNCDAIARWNGEQVIELEQINARRQP